MNFSNISLKKANPLCHHSSRSRFFIPKTHHIPHSEDFRWPLRPLCFAPLFSTDPSPFRLPLSRPRVFAFGSRPLSHPITWAPSPRPSWVPERVSCLVFIPPPGSWPPSEFGPLSLFSRCGKCGCARVYVSVCSRGLVCVHACMVLGTFSILA